jgi:hypothetical protein
MAKRVKEKSGELVGDRHQHLAIVHGEMIH